MKCIKCLLFLLIMGFMVNLNVDAKKLDKHNFKVVDNSIIMNIIETSDGGYFAVGGAMPTDENTWSFPARYAVKLDKNGEIEWEYRDNYIFSFWVKGEETADGNYVVVGPKSDPSTYNIVKFDKNGNVLWEDTGDYYEIENQYIISDYSDLIVDNDGYVAVGTNQISWYENDDPSLPQKNDTDGLIIKYDVNGNILWKNNINLNYDEKYSNILLLDDGTYLVTGTYKSSEIVGNLPATDYYCGLAVNYSKNGNIISQKVHCENDKNVSFGKVIKYGDKYYVEAVISEEKYVYIFDNNYNYINSYNLSDNEADNSFFYIYNEILVWVNIFGDEIPFNAEVNFYDSDFNLLGTDNLIVLFNSTVFNFLVNNEGDLIIPDIIPNYDYSLYSEMFDSQINFYKIVYEVNLEQSIHGNFQVEQDGELGRIVITPDEGYVLDAIKIVDAGGKNKEYYEEAGNYYFELEDGLTISVSYKEVPNVVEDVENPDTGVYLGLRAAFVVLTLISIIYLRIRKKQSFLIN